MKKLDLYLILFALTTFFCYERYLAPDTLEIIKKMGVLFGVLVGAGVVFNYLFSFIYKQGKRLCIRNN